LPFRAPLMPPFAPPKVSSTALLFSGTPSEINSGAWLISRNRFMNEVKSKLNPYFVVLLYGGSTYTTALLGRGALRIVMMSLFKQFTPLIPFTRAEMRRLSSVGPGCIGLAGLRRTLVLVGSQ